MLTRKNDAHLDFDLEKSLQETNDNPSFYVQYAYARINSLKKMALEKKIILDKNNVKNININLSPPEVAIIKTLSLWPRIIETSVISKEPHRLVYYLIELAENFMLTGA